jgi:hypothetical protein
MARRDDPETSRLAAGRVNVTKGQRAVLGALVAAGPSGLTDFDYGPKQTSAGKRRLELARAGLCERTGERRSGVDHELADVWRVTDSGLNLWRSIA